MPLLGLKKAQSDANSRALSAGNPCATGLVLAALQNGTNENFRGKKLLQVDGVTYNFLGVISTADPYYVIGTEQFFAIRTSDSSSNAACGLVVASATEPAEVIRLTNRKVGTGANGALASGVSQEGALWIPPNKAWTAQIELASNNQNLPVAKAYQEVGFMGAATLDTHFIDATKEFGYVDGSTGDVPFVALKFAQGSVALRVRAVAGGAITTSASVVVPAGKHAYRLEYGYSSTGGTPTISLFIDDVFKVSVVATLTGGLQFAARDCHGAAYLAADPTAPVLDIHNILVAIHS